MMYIWELRRRTEDVERKKIREMVESTMIMVEKKVEEAVSEGFYSVMIENNFYDKYSPFIPKWKKEIEEKIGYYFVKIEWLNDEDFVLSWEDDE